MIREIVDALVDMQFHRVRRDREQDFWASHITVRDHLIVLLAEEAVGEWMLGWAVAYLAARPIVQYQYVPWI